MPRRGASLIGLLAYYLGPRPSTGARNWIARFAVIVGMILLVVLITHCAATRWRTDPKPRRLVLALRAAARRLRLRSGAAGRPSRAAPPSRARPDFTHVVVVMFENHEAATSSGTPTRRRSTRSPGVRADDGLRRNRAPEPAELPRDHLRLDARDHDRLHRLRRQREEPRRLARRGRQDVEDVRGGSADPGYTGVSSGGAT